jgi:hypothetical protein
LSASAWHSPEVKPRGSNLLSFPLADDRRVARPLLWAVFGIICILYALLWSPWWYPLSDSSLYLIMARGLMQGRGMGSLRAIHRDVRPLTPLLLFVIMKCRGGIGAMNAAMTVLTLLSHVLAFLTLRKWFNERIALLAMIATAASWWVFANSFTIMTEPMFLVMFWSAMLTLTGMEGARPGGQWTRLVLAALFMIGAFENRIAAVLLLPGIFFGIWMQNAASSWRRRAAWLITFGLMFLAALWEWKRWFIKYPVSPESSGLLTSGDVSGAGPEAYKANLLVGIDNPIIQLPISAGRWILEGLAAVFQVPFNGHISPPIAAAAGIFAFAVFLVTCAGWFWMIRRRRWYAVGMAAYFFPYWIAWGSRIKPRYMMPILPLIFIQLWAGSMLLIALLRRKRSDDAAYVKRRSTAIASPLLAIVILLNAGPYAIDWYIRHGTGMNFYDVARRGACAELVDIGAYVNQHSQPQADIWMNWSPNRRIAHFLCNREIRLLPVAAKRHSPDIDIISPQDTKNLEAYFRLIAKLDPHVEWAIVFYSQNHWPDYHWPLNQESRTEQSPPRYWELFHHEAGRFRAVNVPIDRHEVRTIPGVDVGR